MTVQHPKSNQPTGAGITRYRANFLAEQEGVYLYTHLAEVERDAHRAELCRRLAATEQRHADFWKDEPGQLAAGITFGLGRLIGTAVH